MQAFDEDSEDSISWRPSVRALKLRDFEPSEGPPQGSLRLRSTLPDVSFSGPLVVDLILSRRSPRTVSPLALCQGLAPSRCHRAHVAAGEACVVAVHPHRTGLLAGREASQTEDPGPKR